MQPQIKSADRFLIRNINQSILLNLIRAHAPISRPQLATLSGLSQVTVIKITNNLIERHLILEKEYAESTGGRRAGLLEINPEGGFAIGLIPQPSSLTAVILNLNSDLVYSQQWNITLRDNYPQAIDLFAHCVEELFSKSGIPKEKIIGVGLGMGGLIDAEHGYCIDSWIMNWQNVEISHPLEDRLGIPIFLDNDVNCLAIYEKLFGQGQPYHHFLVVAIGGGVGLGIVINGDLYRGAFGGAGEFGHTAVTTEGRLCVCGNHGCLETYISDAGIVKNYLEYVHATTYNLEKGIQEPTAFELVERAKNGDEAAIAAFQRAGILLGVSLANLVNIFNPECIVLSGPNTDASILAGDLLLEPMRQAFKQHLFSQIGKDLHFIVERRGFESWARGAGSLVLRHFFASPAQVHAEWTLVGS
ncbi:MAG: ROK family protein [Ktedonobacteraceae bacterium]